MPNNNIQVNQLSNSVTFATHIPDKLIVFDGVCNICNGWVQFLLKRDRKSEFFFASAQSVLGGKVLSGNGFSSTELETMLFVTAGRTYDRSDAVIRILCDLGGFWYLVAVLNILPKKFRDLVYITVAKNRYRLGGKRDSCALPSVEMASRFIQ
jgi:predicted DCC family thiol-disulfide oxidoreductase YuxK